jgi:hypothetical protein
VIAQYVVYGDERLVCLLRVEPFRGAWPL